MTEPAPDLAARARAVKADAEHFTHTDLRTWYGAVTALDVGPVNQSADFIIRRWLELHQEQKALTQTAGGSDAVAQASGLGDVTAATTAIDVARRTIGNVVTLQDFGGQPVMGAYRTHPVPADPTTYVDGQRAKAIDVIRVARMLMMTLSAPADGTKLSDGQADMVAHLIEALPDEVAFNFVMAGLRQHGLDHVVHELGGAHGKEVRGFHKKIQEQAAVNRDGLDVDATPEILAQMQTDADELDEAVHKLIVSDDHVNRILGHYKTERQREIFFKLLERRNLIDAILHRADQHHVEAALHATKGFEKREYQASLNTSRSLGEQAAYVGAEMGRELPGALCHFAAGVFKGLSKIPIIGGVFGRSSAAFIELGDAADLATGAWNDKTARAWRNGFAESAGAIDGVLLQGGAAAELQSAEALGAAGEGYQALEAGMDAKRIADTIYSLGDAYHDATLYWQVLGQTFDLVPQLLNDGLHGDPAAMIGDVDGIFDALIARLGGTAETAWTEKGKTAEAEHTRKSAGHDEHTRALRDLGDHMRVMEANGKPTAEDNVELTVRAGALQRAAMDNKGGGPVDLKYGMTPGRPDLLVPNPAFGTGMGRMKHWFVEQLKGALIKLAVLVLKLIKNAVRDVLKEHLAPKPPTAHAAGGSLGDKIIAAVDSHKPDIAKVGDQLIQLVVTKGVKLGIHELAKTWPEDAIEAGVERLVKMADDVIGGAKLIEAPLGKLAHGVARAVVGRVSMLHLSPEPLPAAAPPVVADAPAPGGAP